LKNARLIQFLVVGCVVALGSAGCGEKEELLPESTPITMTGEAREERDLAPIEIDTLRAWRKLLKVTRDEYWNERGGVVGNDWAEVWYPPGKLTVTHGMYVLKHLTATREQAKELFGSLPPNQLMVTCAKSMATYTKDTGKQWWHYSRLQNDRIDFQPVAVLVQRGLLDKATAREFYRWVIQSLAGRRAPLWLEHGFSTLIAGDAQTVQDYLTEFPSDPVVRTLKEIDEALKKNDVKKDIRIAGFNSLKMTERVVGKYGKTATAAFIGELGRGGSLDSASKKHFEQPWNDVLADALDWSKGWTR